MRQTNAGHGASPGRLKLHADIAHPINPVCRAKIERQVVEAYENELLRSRQPGYVPPNLDGEDTDFFETPVPGAAHLRLRPTGTSH